MARLSPGSESLFRYRTLVGGKRREERGRVLVFFSGSHLDYDKSIVWSEHYVITYHTYEGVLGVGCSEKRRKLWTG